MGLCGSIGYTLEQLFFKKKIPQLVATLLEWSELIYTHMLKNKKGFSLKGDASILSGKEVAPTSFT